MQLAQQIKMRQSQSLVMTPQLQQAIKLLQMTNIELCQYLENQQSENPFLEIENSIDSNSKNIKDKKNENITTNVSDGLKNGSSISDDPRITKIMKIDLRQKLLKDLNLTHQVVT